MAKTPLRSRIFAGFGAALFLITASMLTVAVIVDMVKTNDKANTATTACVSNKTETALPAPEVYKPTGDVTQLQTTDLTKGSGTAAKAGDCVVVKYYGTLATDGTVFDENYTKTSAFAFTLGTGQVIKGWDEGVVGMQPGGERRLVIPSDLAYGNQANGAIPANADLVFVVKLLRIQN